MLKNLNNLARIGDFFEGNLIYFGSSLDENITKIKHGLSDTRDRIGGILDHFDAGFWKFLVKQIIKLDIDDPFVGHYKNIKK